MIALGLFISLLVRHFIQYACICVPPFKFMNDRISLEVYVVNKIPILVTLACKVQP